MQKWVNVFRVLANINRLKIIDMLSAGESLDVSTITSNLHISFKATSNHLALLKNADVVGSHGSTGHVFYSLNVNLPANYKKAIKLFLQ